MSKQAAHSRHYYNCRLALIKVNNYNIINIILRSVVCVEDL